MTDFTQSAMGLSASSPETPLPTLQDFIDASADQKIEIIDGEIRPVHPPTRDHDLIAHIILFSLHDHVKANDLGIVLKEAPFVLDGDERSDWVRYSRLPDVAFISKPRVKQHNAAHPNPRSPWWLAPDLAVEVISTGDEFEDVLTKVRDYLRYGVRLVWVIAPKLRSVLVYTPDSLDGVTLAETDTLTASSVIEEWSMPIAQIFDLGLEP